MAGGGSRAWAGGVEFGCGLGLGAGVVLRVAGERFLYDRSVLIVSFIPHVG